MLQLIITCIWIKTEFISFYITSTEYKWNKITCTLLNAKCILYIIYIILYIQYTVFTVYILYHYTVCTVQCTLYTIQYTVYFINRYSILVVVQYSIQRILFAGLSIFCVPLFFNSNNITYSALFNLLYSEFAANKI